MDCLKNPKESVGIIGLSYPSRRPCTNVKLCFPQDYFAELEECKICKRLL